MIKSVDRDGVPGLAAGGQVYPVDNDIPSFSV